MDMEVHGDEADDAGRVGNDRWSPELMVFSQWNVISGSVADR